MQQINADKKLFCLKRSPPLFSLGLSTFRKLPEITKTVLA